MSSFQILLANKNLFIYNRREEQMEIKIETMDMHGEC